jgi:hypothetical protein
METAGRPSGGEPEARRAALEEVLHSQTFARSEQLRNFLRYVCEKEIAGQASEIKEYSIGVEVFRRGGDYSPATDSTVRSRAWELRQKLEEYYRTEKPDAALRIVLTKGSYIPAFVEAVTAAAPSSPPEVPPVPDRSSPRLLSLALAFLAGALLCGVAALLLGQANRPKGASPPVLMEASGPMAAAQANVLMCVSSGLHMVVRAEPFGEAVHGPHYNAPPELAAIFRQHRPLAAGAELYMRPVDSVVSIGVLSGAVIAGNTLRSLGASYQVLPERAAPLPSFRGRNVILFGEPRSSNAAAQLLSRTPLSIEYDAVEKRMVIQRRPKQGSLPPAYSRRDRDGTGPAIVYGLITVLPGEGPSPEKRRVMVVSGISSVGAHGAMEYFSSPEKLEKLRARFRQQGFPDFPPAYQVVVACKADDTLLLSADYAGHEIVQ